MRTSSVAGLGLVLAAVAGAPAFIGAGQSIDAPAGSTTFAEHVAPIVYKHCVSCHRPGEAAPFSLMSYEDARPHGEEIADVTRTRFMPPWKPAPADYPYAGERRLTDAEIDVLKRWVADGMHRGDPRKGPKPPVFKDGWPLGKPDLIVTMPEAFPVPASGRDVYRNFVIPLDLKKDEWVRAVDYRPSARSVVHHVLFFLDGTGAARQKDADDPGPGFGGVMGGSGIGGRTGPADILARVRGGETTALPPPTRGGGAIGGWAPGGSPHAMPDDLAMPLPRGSDLILSTHFHSSGKAERETSTLALYFAKRPPTRPFMAVQLPPFTGAFKGINIAPGNANYTITDTFVLPVDVKAFATGAHAHYLAREMKLTATLPGGAVKTLLSIPDWDLNWQGTYDFQDYVPLPAGTRLDMKIRYDNSSVNPHNPSSPPVRVTFGEQSTNEMGSMTLAVIAAQPGGLVKLREAYDRHIREAVLASPMMRGRGPAR